MGSKTPQSDNVLSLSKSFQRETPFSSISHVVQSAMAPSFKDLIPTIVSYLALPYDPLQYQLMATIPVKAARDLSEIVYSRGELLLCANDDPNGISVYTEGKWSELSRIIYLKDKPEGLVPRNLAVVEGPSPDNDRLFIVYATSTVIHEFTRSGDFIRPFAELPATIFSFTASSDRVFVLTDRTISIFALTGGLVATLPAHGWFHLSYCPFSYRLFFADQVKDCVTVFAVPPDPTSPAQAYHKLFTFGQRGSKNGQFQLCAGLATRYNGEEVEIIVADLFNHRVQFFHLDGRFKYSFGEGGNELSSPVNVTVLADGRIAVRDKFGGVKIFK